MRPLTATDILRIWELGERQGPFHQALTLLTATYPESTLDQLADLSRGQRDRLLFTLRERMFGSELRGFAECPQCRERLEFGLGIAEICGAAPAEVTSGEQSFSIEGYDLCFRLPTSRDMISAAACRGPQQARKLLIQHCLQECRHDGRIVTCEELPEFVIATVAHRLSQCDPLQEVLLDLTCPACKHGWQSLFDIVTFLWAELGNQAKKILREVHLLARAYGWREADILALSTRRRHAYLEMVGA